ncbi:HAD family hydrolase [Vibrio sp. 10N.261.51.F12]|uniref:HAD family hydrolase n=1 Tax=Vibrio sp. 10N.261.51.F12 TaxID=3229679 RepID=UPI00355070B1
MSKPLYVFDMDETLFDADCAMLWNEFLVEKGIAIQVDFLEQDQRLMTLYAQGELDMEDYLSFSMAPLQGVSKSQVASLVNECIDEKIMPRFFPQAKARLAELKRDAIDTVIISASVSFLVQAIGQRIGIDTAMGIDLIEDKNAYTAQIKGIPTYRDGKVLRLKQWLEAGDRHYTSIHFYTDSINDLPLCEYADFAYLVNPCPRLKAMSDRENWQVLEWSV